MSAETQRALASLDILQLQSSERGRAALVALHDFLSVDATYSLDSANQQAIAQLFSRALDTPSVRELVSEAAEGHE